MIARLETNQLGEKKARPRPSFLRALGRDDPPAFIEFGQGLQSGAGRFERRDILKHDSVAATALYEDTEGRGEKVVCKFNRRQSVLGVPTRWIGHRLAAHERRVLEAMEDVDSIPNPIGDVYVDGEVDRTAAAHEFVPGHPLAQGERVGDACCGERKEAVAALHAHDIACVDLNKRENIIVGEDGRPYLIDFQISFALPAWWPGRSAPVQWFLRLLQDCDWYHVSKHLTRHRPDLAPRAARETVSTPPLPIRIHRSFAMPARELRRKFLVLIRVRTGKGRSHSEVDPEDAVRRSLRREVTGDELKESRRRGSPPPEERDRLPSPRMGSRQAEVPGSTRSDRWR